MSSDRPLWDLNFLIVVQQPRVVVRRSSSTRRSFGLNSLLTRSQFRRALSPVTVRDLETFVNETAKIGIELNAAKCKILVMNVEDEASRQTIVKDFQNLARYRIDHSRPVESSIKLFFCSNVEAEIANLQPQLSMLCERIDELFSQETLFLIKNTLFIPKLLYKLRTASP
ncbi:hypothetical protein ACOME3_007910 [Neoechinorhynchus agilis]